jgi:hypothetical protein
MRLPVTESNPSRESTKPAFLATRGPIPTLKGKEALPC